MSVTKLTKMARLNILGTAQHKEQLTAARGADRMIRGVCVAAKRKLNSFSFASMLKAYSLGELVPSLLLYR
jgi:hypothetical protein